MFYSFFPVFPTKFYSGPASLHLESGPILHNFIKSITVSGPEPVFSASVTITLPGSIPVSLMYDTFHKPLKLFLPALVNRQPGGASVSCLPLIQYVMPVPVLPLQNGRSSFSYSRLTSVRPTAGMVGPAPTGPWPPVSLPYAPEDIRRDRPSQGFR